MERTIEVSTPLRVVFAQARDVLFDDPGAVLSEAPTVDERDATRFRTELSVDVGAGAGVHQEVLMQLGIARSTETGSSCRWRGMPRAGSDCFRRSGGSWKSRGPAHAHGCGSAGRTPCRSARSDESATVSSAGDSPAALCMRCWSASYGASSPRWSAAAGRRGGVCHQVPSPRPNGNTRRSTSAERPRRSGFLTRTCRGPASFAVPFVAGPAFAGRVRGHDRFLRARGEVILLIHRSWLPRCRHHRDRCQPMGGRTPARRSVRAPSPRSP